MANVLKAIWRAYAVIGAIWLTFTLISLFYYRRPTIHNVDGVVEEIFVAEWDGYRDDIALIQTEDSNGNVLARDYRGRVRVGDQVSLEISTGGVSGSYIHAAIESAPSRKGK